MNKLELLTSLAEKYQTDKRESYHGYIKYYAKHLPDTCRFFAEVGCEHGRSAEMWSEFYGNDELDLTLIDLFINTEFKSPRWARNKGFIPAIGDQSDTNFLYTIKQKFEVCVEDGSHQSDHQQITFKHLFINNMVAGSLFVSEDLHCCLDPFYWNGYVQSFDDTFLAVLKRYKETGEFSGVYFTETEAKYFNDHVDTVDIYDDKIAFITKR
jgi:hypothetical protein